MKTNGRQWEWGVVAAMVLAGCARESALLARAAQTEQALRDLSSIPVGRGYDRALDADREECFDRDQAIVTPVSRWEGTGFTVFTANELDTKMRTAIQVGVKVEATEGHLGAVTAGRIGPSGERSNFVMLARYTARTEDAGPIKAAAGLCAQVGSRSQNGVEDFVSTCGDRYLAQKVYGGHVLVSWRRDPSRASVDDVMGLMLGARTIGATLDPQANLATLEARGLGKEEVFIEAAGVPFGPTQVTLPSGQLGFTITSAREYLEALARANVSSFPRVVDYSMARYSVAEIDSCLAFTGRQSALAEPEWACVYDRLTELADTRDGEGDLAHLRDRYEVHRLALTAQLSRVVFNTVPQSRCSVDADGDPALEKSGPCQEQALRDFVKFFEACTVRSAEVLSECRDPVLAEVLSCAAFEAKGCTLPQLTLSDGTVVTCDEAGVNAALADVIPYQVLPPFSPAPQPSTFVPPLVLQFGQTGARLTPIPGVSPATDLCGITAVTGGLHGSSVNVESWGSDWMVAVNAGSPDRDKQVSVEVTCVKLENFYHLNGGTHAVSDSRATTIPALNGTTHTEYLLDPGNPMLGGWIGYLDEPSTVIQVTNPDATGFGLYVGTDLFPFVSTQPILTAYSVQSNPPRSGSDPGGTLMSRVPGRPSSRAASIGISNRSPNTMSAPLSSNAFCYLTGLSGRYFNTSDSVRISTSDGFTTLSVSTPLAKDRNPGAIAQCALFDQY